MLVSSLQGQSTPTWVVTLQLNSNSLSSLFDPWCLCLGSYGRRCPLPGTLWFGLYGPRTDLLLLDAHLLSHVQKPVCCRGVVELALIEAVDQSILGVAVGLHLLQDCFVNHKRLLLWYHVLLLDQCRCHVAFGLLRLIVVS